MVVLEVMNCGSFQLALNFQPEPLVIFLFFLIGNPLPLVPLVDSVNSCSELSVEEQQGADSLSLDMTRISVYADANKKPRDWAIPMARELHSLKIKSRISWNDCVREMSWKKPILCIIALGHPRPDPCTLEAQEGTIKGVYELLHAIY